MTYFQTPTGILCGVIFRLPDVSRRSNMKKVPRSFDLKIWKTPYTPNAPLIPQKVAVWGFVVTKSQFSCARNKSIYYSDCPNWDAWKTLRSPTFFTAATQSRGTWLMAPKPALSLGYSILVYIMPSHAHPRK